MPDRCRSRRLGSHLSTGAISSKTGRLEGSWREGSEREVERDWLAQRLGALKHPSRIVFEIVVDLAGANLMFGHVGPQSR
jgi:hypothetical protein